MKSKTYYHVLSILIICIAALLTLCLIGGLTLGVVLLTREPQKTDTESTPVESSSDDVPTSIDPALLYLSPTADAGLAYQDSLIFFGESTTAHLASRGVLTGGTATQQVWADRSNTCMLSSRITSATIVYPETGEDLTIAEACDRKKPSLIVLSFGQNGLVSFASDTEGYCRNYKKLIGAIREASPDTKIILQTVYPLSQEGNYGTDVATLNGYVNTLNECLPEIASAFENVRIADTASVLRDGDGRLAASYDFGDGQHLTASAYEAILSYLRTHAYD